jgi:Domain of unknown function (DUF892)
MCRYGTLIAWAEELCHDEIVRFLTTNLNEEKAANTKLHTVVLRKGVNAKASTQPKTHLPGLAASRHRGAAIPSRPVDRSQLVSGKPARDGNDEPGQRCRGERAGDATLGNPAEHGRTRQHSEGTERGTGGVEGGGLTPAPFADESDLALASDLMALDERRAGEEDRWERQEEAADGRPVATTDEAGKDRRRPAERKADHVLIPVALAK